jgi:hypothetical protein
VEKKAAVIACCLLVLAAMQGLADEGTRRYEVIHGQRSGTIEYTTQRSDTGFRVSTIDTDSSETLLWTAAAGTTSWKLLDTRKQIDLEAVRSGDMIRVKGSLGGRTVAREIKVDPAPWYQVFGPVIDQLLPGLQGQREFWVVNPDDMSAHKMMARRAGTERISVRGTAVETIKVHFSPSGALAPFWGADYWFSAADTVYVYSRLPEDGGLTVTTIGEPLH